MARMLQTKAPDMVFSNPEMAERYKKFRPAPPPALISTVVEHVKEGRRKAGGAAELCVDLGCGTGQNTALLAPHFAAVVGVDVGQPQIDMAVKTLKHLPNVSFKLGSAEVLPFKAGSVDLVTCCAAVHWFDLEIFYKEVDRVLRPGGVLACYAYSIWCSKTFCNGRNLSSVTVELYDELIHYLPEGVCRTVKSEYSSLPQLYPTDTHIGTKERPFSVMTEGVERMEDLIGFVSTWSGLEKLRKYNGEQAAAEYLARARKRYCEAAGVDVEDSSVGVSLQFDYFLRMWQKAYL